MNWTLIVTVGLMLLSPFHLATSQELEAAFTASVTSGEAPLTVEFDASASTGSDELSYEWRFGDGSRAEGVRASHTFERLGELAAVLILKSGDKQVTETQIITVTGDGSPEIIQLPFTIDSELREGTYIQSAGLTYLDSAETVSISNFEEDPEGYRGYVNLTNENFEPIAFDVVIPNVKETVTFDAANTVRAFNYSLLSSAAIPNPYLTEIYLRIDQHPKFQEAVERLNATQGLTSDEEGIELILFIEHIGEEVARQYLVEKGIDPNLYLREAP